MTHSLPPRSTDPMELCRYEQALALAYDGPDAIGALHGWVDAGVEKAIIEEGFVVPTIPKPTSSYSDFLIRKSQSDTYSRSLAVGASEREVDGRVKENK